MIKFGKKPVEALQELQNDVCKLWVEGGGWRGWHYLTGEKAGFYVFSDMGRASMDEVMDDFRIMAVEHLTRNLLATLGHAEGDVK